MLDYKFTIKVGTSGTEQQVWPIYKDDIAIECKLESQQQFYRRQLSGSLVFVGADYNLIMGQSFGTVFYLTIYKTANRGASYTEYWKGRFTHTDCTINTDDKKVSAKADVVDQYTEILAGWEKEFDLIKLTPEIQRMLVRKRPMIQIYTEGDDTISCFLGTIAFEMDVSIPSDVDDIYDYLRYTCHFSVIEDAVEINFTEVPEAYQADFLQPFTGILTNGAYLTNTTNVYRIQYYEYNEYHSEERGVRYYNGLRVKAVGSDTVLWEFAQSRLHTGYLDIPEDLEFESQQEGVDNLFAVKASIRIWSRIVTNCEYMENSETYPLYSNDLVTYNRNYLRAIGYKSGVNEIQNSSRTSQTPTEWGVNDLGEYFMPPTDDSRWVPIGRSRWINTSVWFMPSTYTQMAELEGRDVYMLNDTYPLASCLSVLLGQITSNVTFEGTTTYSQFLYEVLNNGNKRELYLTPKSNMTAGEYQTPAQKAPVTLKDLLTMLRDTYRCYWFVDASNRLRIEHVEWFMRGGQYSGGMTVGIDLTTLENVRNRQKWAFATSEYSYDKSNMPERYEFEWMDEVTAPFKGNPIDVVSPFVQQGEIEDVHLSKFTTDVDYMLLNPSAISKDGFALMTATAPDALSYSNVLIYKYEDGYTDIINFSSYVAGRQVVIYISNAGGLGTAELVWYKENEVIHSGVSINLPQSSATLYVTVPEGARGLAFYIEQEIVLSLGYMRAINDNAMQLPMINDTFNGQSIIMQNGYLSFLRLQNPYWRYDMPSWAIRLNGVETGVYMISRNKKQTVQFPSGDSDPNEQQLIKTYVGSGKIDSMQVRLTSRMVKANLVFDTY